MFNCEFSNPVNWQGEPPEELELWQFKNSTCNLEYMLVVENATTDAEFYLDRTINYGELLIIFFLVIFLIFGIANLIAKFVFKFYDR